VNPRLPSRLVLLLAAASAFGAAALCAAGERPEDLAGTEETPGPKPGWLRVAKSLLYYDADGQLANEIGLGRWEDSDPARAHVKVIAGGSSPNNRFAWTLDKRTTWNTSKTKLLESTRVLRFFDSSGNELWTEEEADFLPGSDPLVSSQDGEVCLIALRRQSGWFAAVKTYLGNTLWELGPFPRLEALQISPNGRYALARWGDPDRSAVHSFLDLTGRKRQDVPSDRFVLGKAVVDDQGRAFSGKDLVFSFSETALSTTTVPSVSTAPAKTPAPAPASSQGSRP